MAVSASALQSVQLKATANKKDSSVPLSIEAEETREKRKERRDYFFSTGLDQWYRDLHDVTIPSIFIDLTPGEAGEIIACWKRYFCHKSSHDPIPNESEITIPQSLNNLADRISKAMSEISSGEGVFVKLSTRSPKDSHIAFARARNEYRSQLSKQLATLSVNDRLIQFGDIVVDSLRVKNGHEAVKLFISSDRVGEDLEYALELEDRDFSTRVSIAIRKWIDIPLWSEFRGFVWDGKLTCIGQYSHPVVFKELQGRTEQIKADLKQFYDQVKGKIPLQKYMIDFAWTRDTVYLIEINPFDGEIVYPASTGLWSWETDREQMTRGELQLRIKTEEDSDFTLKKNLDPNWRNVLFT